MPFVIALLLAGSMLTTLVGCDHFFGHDKQVQDPLTVKEQGLSCVRSVGTDVQGFLAGEDKDPVRIVDCISGALTKFSDNTRGANRDGWTRGELASFFETYFKEESQSKSIQVTTSASLHDGANGNRSGDVVAVPFDSDWVAQARRRAVVTELFRWKAALFGGGDATLSRDELSRIRDILKNARVPLAEWRGQGKLLSLRAELASPVDLAKLERLSNSIRSIGDIVVSELSVGMAALSHARGREPMKLQTLSTSLDQAGIDALDSPERMQLVEALKGFVLAGDSQQIAGDEWSELVHQAAEFWIGALRLQYGVVHNRGAFNLETLPFIEKTASDINASLRRMIDRHGGRIDNSQIRSVMKQLDANEMLPPMVKAKSVNASLEVIFGKLLSGNSRTNQIEMSKGLQPQHLDRLFEVIRDWTEGQRVAVAIAGPAGQATVGQAKMVMSHLAASAREDIGETVRQQMFELIMQGRPLVHDAEGRLLIVPMSSISGYSRGDLDNLNLTRTLMSAAMRAYSHENSRAGVMPQITESEIQELFMDLKAIGRDLGIVDVRSLQSGVRTFMEANIFLSVSDGNSFISLHEMVEWFETVMSAGYAADKIHDDLVKDEAGAPRCGTSPVDVFGKQRLKAQCFRDNALPVLRKRLSHLPNFMRALNEAERKKQVPQLIQALEKATRALGDSDLPIESSDVRVMSPVIHYAEALFARYDVNRTANLETEEVWSVFPLIRPFIQKLAVDENGVPLKLSPYQERVVFSWLLEEGTPPGITKTEKLRVVGHMISMWAKNLTSFEVFGYKTKWKREQASFDDIIKILASFQQVGRDKKNRDLIRYYKDHAQSWELAITRGERKEMEKTRDLFQCSVEADVDLARLVQARRADIFAVDAKLNEDAQALLFATRFKSMIQADPQLQLLCLAF